MMDARVVRQAGNLVALGVVSMDHDLLSVKSEVLDLTELSIADLRAQDGTLLVSSATGLLRQVYRARGNFGPADPPQASVD
jgi:hypothetical protein